ncbi:DEAD/DEAH box helicase [Pseudohongiella spirulinae]|uniref:ATP-dependent DNA helicase n=1 Tax=Pseudohongiella spirulinae TaxID=1249552 RepID=A0A0S2KAH9_9GAMM|nr:DEAD/DEAH box helicase [Pseudohongiella spirulinae]ALO45091.1 ATP-dependent DNA helicase [Pseudohongiella spirulinae]
MSLSSFHPASRAWFEAVLGQPTPAQAEAWPAIQAGKHTLIAAPTGSGKTLAAFYAAIDQLVQEAQQAPLPDQTRILYISPLKALSNDIERNLQQPLAGIEDELFMQCARPAGIRIAVRTGDTPQTERQKMLKKPPHILVTTPESVYLLLTSGQGRNLLRSVTTVIIDEIHAMLGDKRGSHLALSLERLQALIDGQPGAATKKSGTLQRIGLSATQKPIDLVANYLVARGTEATSVPDCVIVDSGHRRQLDIQIEVPSSPLSALMSNEVWGELYERLVELIQQHRTTLVFVNTRRLSERLALALSGRLGSESLYGEGGAALVSSHHGSMSKERRHKAEQQLKAGKLKVLVATASMELGIDIGAVDLVVQFASPHSIATFLQRVGRSGHQVGGTPKGVLFPLTRDDLVECTALVDSIRRGELDKILMPEQPLDILAQQIVAELAARQDEDTAPQSLDELYTLCTRAWPYRNLPREQFDALVQMLADGYSTRLGRRGAWLHLDRIHNRASARRGARLTALTNGGAIPDMFDYQVVLDPDDTVVGSLNEDFALETLPGDIFALGTHAWQMVRVDGLKVRVRDAHGQKPTVPFWFGEGPGRTAELSVSVARLREEIDERLQDAGPSQALNWLKSEVGLPTAAAAQLVEYLHAGRTALGMMPSQQRIVMERFFDEVGDMHVVIHAPFGNRLNKAWGLALRKRFCRTFNFELQAAANEDSIVISLGSVHSFPLEEVFQYLHSNSATDVLTQALLDAPMFEVRWRWNATRSLAIQRNRSGKRVPPQFQRMDAEDLVAQVFPDQIACLENITGKRDVPEHPLVKQTIHDCLTEAMDIDGLLELLRQMENKEIELVALDLREPSPFAQEIINARPYAFLDDAPFEERRTLAIRNRSWVDPAEAGDYSRLDEAAIERVRDEAWPLMRDAEELHDALYCAGFMTPQEVQKNTGAERFLQALVTQGRVCRIAEPEVLKNGLWITAEMLPVFRLLFAGLKAEPEPDLPASLATQALTEEAAVQTIVRRRLDVSGPVTALALVEHSGISAKKIELALMTLEREGFVFRGRFSRSSVGRTDDASLQWCERRLLQRIHRYTLDAHREAIKPVSLQAYTCYLFELHELRCQSLTPRPQALPSAPAAQAILERTVERLDGMVAPAAAWEGDIFASRLSLYDPSWLDGLCSSGRLTWGRYSQPAPLTAVRAGSKRSGGPIKSTPITLSSRTLMPVWQQLAASGERDGPDLSANAARVQDDLKQHGASFFAEIRQRTGLLASQLEQALSELVAAGLLTSDGFTGLRALLTPDARKPALNGSAAKTRGGRSRKTGFSVEDAGRWSLLRRPSGAELSEEDLESLIDVYLQRWGVLSRQILQRENCVPAWRDLLPVLRRRELRGTLRGGRFIEGLGGEQFTLPETVAPLREQARKLRELSSSNAGTSDWESSTYVSLTATDPVNHLPLFLPDVKLARSSRNRVLYKNGIPIAVLDGNTVRFLREVPAEHQWALEQLLRRQDVNPRLRAYLA